MHEWYSDSKFRIRADLVDLRESHLHNYGHFIINITFLISFSLFLLSSSCLLLPLSFLPHSLLFHLITALVSWEITALKRLKRWKTVFKDKCHWDTNLLYANVRDKIFLIYFSRIRKIRVAQVYKFAILCRPEFTYGLVTIQLLIYF